MFRKEALNYGYHQTLGISVSEMEQSADDWQEGAEFGYNKAKSESEEQIEELEAQTAKAKEIIKKMLYEYQRLCLIKKETLTEAEQFLEEKKGED